MGIQLVAKDLQGRKFHNLPVTYSRYLFQMPNSSEKIMSSLKLF